MAPGLPDGLVNGRLMNHRRDRHSARQVRDGRQGRQYNESEEKKRLPEKERKEKNGYANQKKGIIKEAKEFEHEGKKNARQKR